MSATDLADALVANRTLGLAQGGECEAVTRALDEEAWLKRRVAMLAPSMTHVVDTGRRAESGIVDAIDEMPPVAAMQLHHQVTTLLITETDLARGWVDVPAGSRFSVATTSRDGYVVDIVPSLPIFASVQVRSPIASADLGPDGGTLVTRGRPGRDADVVLSYRFVLARDVRPGRYRFPLQLVVRPL